MWERQHLYQETISSQCPWTEMRGEHEHPQNLSGGGWGSDYRGWGHAVSRWPSRGEQTQGEKREEILVTQGGTTPGPVSYR